MSEDDDTDCPAHDWHLTGMTLGLDGAHLDYVCCGCGALMLIPPTGRPPGRG